MDKNDNVQETLNNKENEELDNNNNEEDNIGNLNINEIFNSINETNNTKENNKVKSKDNKLTEINEDISLMNMEIYNKEKANLEYEKLIKENPDELFKVITQETVDNWKKILYPKIQNIINEDCNILNSENTKENYKIVSNDIPRTRSRENILVNSFSSLLENLISYYCMENKIIYKQGLNEIIAPFLFIKYKLPNIPYHDIYNLFCGYINTFATNYYYEKTCFSLKNSLCLLSLLLKYHEPILQNLFDKLMITPEMYGTNWIMTIFCGKLKLHLIYHLMNKIIVEDDPLILHYLIVAFLIYKKNVFFESDLTMIPVVITKISIDSIKEIDEIYNEAIKLRENTPYSLRIFANLLEIFKYHCEDPKAIYEKYKPDSLLTLPIFPSEIFYICYKGATKCPDDNCKNNIKNKNSLDDDDKDLYEMKDNLKKCELCDMKIKKDLNYILLDLRILEFEDQEEKTGFLPKVIRIEQKLLKSKYFTDTMIQRFNDEKGKYHFIFLTSKTDFFNEFEENFYVESKENNLLNIQFKQDKEINKDLLNKMSQKERYKLKEYDNMKKLLISLLENNYPYISFIYGGFEEIHEQISQYKIDIYLLNHDKDCEICKKKKHNNSKWLSNHIDSFLKKSKHFINEIESKIDKDKKEKNSYLVRMSSLNNLKMRNNEKLKSKKYLSMDELSQIISNYENFVKNCLLIKYKENEFNENDNKGMLVIQKYYFIILKMQDNDEKAEQIDKIIINFIDKVELKKKNFINIDFIDAEKKKFNLYVKFNLEQDAKKLLNEINKIKAMKSN